MLRIAVVDDEDAQRSELVAMVERYGRENDLELRTLEFADGRGLIESDVAPHLDIILLDIEMADVDGMKAARRLRAAGVAAQIVFVTNMAQYAIKGYEVGALDFIVKPVRYASLAFRLSRAVELALRRRASRVQITCKGVVHQVLASDIHYVEVSRHRLRYHTARGVLESWGTMRAARERLEPLGFSPCGASFLINLESVTSLTRDTVTVAGEQVRVSRGYRQEFFDALTRFGGA